MGATYISDKYILLYQKKRLAFDGSLCLKDGNCAICVNTTLFHVLLVHTFQLK